MKQLITGVLTAMALWGCAPSEQHSLNTYSEQDRQDVKHLLQIGQTGKRMQFNFSDEAQYRLYTKMLYRSGINENTNPQFFKVLEATRQHHVKTLQPTAVLQDTASSFAEIAGPVNIITSFDTKDQVHYTTSGLSSIPIEVLSSTISLGLFNQNGDTIGPTVGKSAYLNSRDLQVATFGTENENALTGKVGGKAARIDTVNSLFAYFYQDKSGDTHTGFQVASSANVVDSVINIKPMPCQLGQPVGECNNAPCADTSIITVCMTRKTPACTYCFGGLAPNFMFPLQGRIVYNGKVNVDGNGKPNSGAFYNITVARLPVGGGCAGIPIGGNFWDYVTVKDSVLSWNVPTAQFQNSCLASGDQVLFQLTIFVKVGNQPAFATITNAASATPPTLKIPPMQIVSGCLAKGTNITMDGGKVMKIEDVPMQGKVMASPGKPAYCVEYNTTGHEPHPMIRVIDDKGHNLLVTQDHPMAIPGGIVQAAQLKVKDKILTDKGEASIVSLNQEKYSGEVWNLALTRCDKNQEAPGKNNALFYANGILVGDSRLQQYYKFEQPYAKDSILKKLPKEWHQDYLNSLKKQ
ncbi:Hint domain-containing protein [Chitinophaga vietnamensis]|uniref:Hint domain-containing protein n=1 Tax=Chitinophaga vietnamensis TaxID=2593957 RepID=UPI001178CBBC|nr:Hint domain-containing protein [Chitinophaga vietnamensis]